MRERAALIAGGKKERSEHAAKALDLGPRISTRMIGMHGPKRYLFHSICVFGLLDAGPAIEALCELPPFRENCYDGHVVADSIA